MFHGLEGKWWTNPVEHSMFHAFQENDMAKTPLNQKREEQPHWRRKTTFSFTQEDQLRFERLHDKAYSVSPGINRSQLVRVALIMLEAAPEAKFEHAVTHTAIPRMGMKPQGKHRSKNDEWTDDRDVWGEDSSDEETETRETSIGVQIREMIPRLQYSKISIQTVLKKH